MLLNFLIFVLFEYFINLVANKLYLETLIIVRDVFSYLLSFLLIHLICKRKLSNYRFKFENYKIIALAILAAIMLDFGIGLPFYHLIPKPFFFQPDLTGLSPRLNTIVVALILAPFFEELIMRGVILDGLLQNKGAKTAILIGAILFTLMHLSVEKIPSLFFGSIFIGWIYYKTKSLMLPILIHLFNNLISIYQLYFFKDLRVGKDGIDSIYGDHTIVIIVVFNLILIISLYFLNRQFKKSE